ncbi:uncharacterized protein Dvar_03570 [Desulfosarcina variabilis str. Montpellier]
MSLQYTKPPAEIMNRGSIVVVVDDQRPPEEGGNDLHMALKKNGNSVPRWEQTVESTTGVVWTVGYGPFDDGINTMLEDLKKQILTTFKDPKFQSEFDLL